jgi:hypothetical protein
MNDQTQPLKTEAEAPSQVQEPDVKTGEDMVVYLKSCWTAYSDARFRFERNWYIADNFYDGNHFVWFKKETGTIDKITAPKGTVLRAIPKASKQVEVVQNLIISNSYKWTAYPQPDDQGQISDDATKFALRQGQWLRTQFDNMNMDKKIADLVLFALKFPVSFWEFYPTEDNNIGNTTYDAFDIYFKPDVEDIYDSPVVIKCIDKAWDEIKANPEYTIPEGYQPLEQRNAYASELKSLRYNEKYGHKFGEMGRKSIVTLKEGWVKEWYTDQETTEVDSGQVDPTTQQAIKITTTKPVKKKRIRVVTYLDELKTPLRDKITVYTDYPFVAYSPKSGSLYQPSLLERLMSANKSIDLIVSGIEQFMHTMNKGRWLKHRNASLSKIYNENGQILEWDVEKPELVPQQSIPNYFFSHIANLEKWIEEQSANAATSGRVPQGARAYKTIEALKSSDAANQSVSIINLETALEKAAQICLEIADKYFDQPQTVYRMDKQKPDYFKVVGDRYKTPEMNDTVPLSENTKVDVSIESGLSYTEEGKRQTLLELYQMGLLDKETVLEGFKFGNIGEILEKVNAEVSKSMIDTPDFQALDPQTQKAILTELQSKNFSMPQTPQDLENRNVTAMRKRLR